MDSDDPNLRIGDAQRDQAGRRLQQAYAEGRLDKSEFDERLEQVYRSKTIADLTPVMADLPAEAGPQNVAPYYGAMPAGPPYPGYVAGYNMPSAYQMPATYHMPAEYQMPAQYQMPGQYQMPAQYQMSGQYQPHGLQAYQPRGMERDKRSSEVINMVLVASLLSVLGAGVFGFSYAFWPLCLVVLIAACVKAGTKNRRRRP